MRPFPEGDSFYRKNRRPIIYVARSRYELRVELCAFFGLLAVISLAIWALSMLPATIPTHFDFAGRPDSYGSKVPPFVMLPCITVILYVLLSVLGRFPHIFNYPVLITQENAPYQYRLARTLLRWLKLFICWMLAVIEWFFVQGALDGHQDFPTLPLILILAAFPVVVVVIYVVRARRQG